MAHKISQLNWNCYIGYLIIINRCNLILCILSHRFSLRTVFFLAPLINSRFSKVQQRYSLDKFYNSNSWINDFVLLNIVFRAISSQFKNNHCNVWWKINFTNDLESHFSNNDQTHASLLLSLSECRTVKRLRHVTDFWEVSGVSVNWKLLADWIHKKMCTQSCKCE